MIKAKIEAENPQANLGPYEKARQSFSWMEIESEFPWSRTGKLNMAHEAVDRWVKDPAAAERAALIFEKAGQSETFSYQRLKEISGQWTNLLHREGFQPGERLFIFLPLCPEVYLSMLACTRLGVIFAPLLAGLSYDELEVRLQNAKPRGVLTHPDLAERLPREAMKSVERVLFIEGPLPGQFKGEILVPEALEALPLESQTAWLDKKAPLYLIFTSGSTGPPKAVVHSHGDMLGLKMTSRYVLDLRPDSILWTEADPAWVTGTVYATFGPWLCQACSIVQGDPFSASTVYRTLERHKVSVWYTTPVTIRRLVEAGDDLPGRYDFSRLSHIASVGEALTPELFYWVRQNLKHTPHDTWWMAETGMICIANFPTLETKPGSMGKPVPGVEAAVVDENGEPLPMLGLGELALKPDWPAMMTGLWADRARYEEYFKLKGWFLTGDMAVRDEEGYFYHQGRNDDLIKFGDKFIGPFDVERVLCLHPAVAEAAVISVKSPRGQRVIKAFVTIDQGFTASARLNQEIRAFIKGNLSSPVPLEEIVFMDELPKTSSGKLLRRALRARELGLPAGDTNRIKD